MKQRKKENVGIEFLKSRVKVSFQVYNFLNGTISVQIRQKKKNRKKERNKKIRLFLF